MGQQQLLKGLTKFEKEGTTLILDGCLISTTERTAVRVLINLTTQQKYFDLNATCVVPSPTEEEMESMRKLITSQNVDPEDLLLFALKNLATRDE
jgi:hypothetical protein